MSVELKNAAFEAIYKHGCEDCGDWVDTLCSSRYARYVVDEFGDNPFEATALLTDWWESMDYEDPRTGICLTYRDWAEYFAGQFSHVIYDELIKTKQELMSQKNGGTSNLVSDERMKELKKRMKEILNKKNE